MTNLTLCKVTTYSFASKMGSPLSHTKSGKGCAQEIRNSSTCRNGGKSVEQCNGRLWKFKQKYCRYCKEWDGGGWGWASWALTECEQWGRRLDGCPKSATRLPGWRRVNQARYYFLRDGRSMHAASLTDHHTVMSYVTQGSHGLVLTLQ